MSSKPSSQMLELEASEHKRKIPGAVRHCSPGYVAGQSHNSRFSLSALWL